MKADGRWAWLNQYAVPALDIMIARANQVEGVIIKWGMLERRRALEAAGVLWAVEAYVYPDQAALWVWGERLAGWVNEGAQFVVINAEVEWEQTDRQPMIDLISAIRLHSHNAHIELYASVDTRGGRTGLPYQRVLADNCAGWMPMIYPIAFQQSVDRAFISCLDSGQQFNGLPIFPTIQTYDQVGPIPVDLELQEVARRGLPGCQAYTIGHATEGEWETFVRGYEPARFQEDESMLRDTIVGFDGRPVEYTVLVGGAPNFPVKKMVLTYGRWLQLRALGLLVEPATAISGTVPPHTHTGRVTLS